MLEFASVFVCGLGMAQTEYVSGGICGSIISHTVRQRGELQRTIL